MMLAQQVVRVLTHKGLTLACAESCSGGGVSHQIVLVPGASDCFVAGVVAYANHAKTSLLGVSQEILQQHGAVSFACTDAMLEGVLARTGADLAVAISGIAGPTGGCPQKPVGLVYYSYGGAGDIQRYSHHFTGNREQVIAESTRMALEKLLEWMCP